MADGEPKAPVRRRTRKPESTPKPTPVGSTG